MTHDSLLNDLIVKVSAELPIAAKHLESADYGLRRQIDLEVDYYIRQQLDCIAHVALDVSLLAGHSRFHNLSALCRLAFEARIHFLSAFQIESYVPRKFIDDTSEHVAALTKMTGEPVLGALAGQELQRHQTYLKSLLARYSGIPERRWNFKEAADHVGLLNEYSERYSVLSTAIHNTPTGILTKDHRYIVVYSITHLFSDILDVIEFTIAPVGGANQGPLSDAWKQLLAPLAEMAKRRGQFQAELARFTLDTVIES